MLIVKASARSSAINGIGLFADEKILKGTVIWKYNPRFDISFSKDEVLKMNTGQKTLVLEYAYLSKKLDAYIYSIDDSRFTNHSSKEANEDAILMPGDIETSGIANRDIEIGEEILINYRTIDAEDSESSEPYLND